MNIPGYLRDTLYVTSLCALSVCTLDISALNLNTSRIVGVISN